MLKNTARTGLPRILEARYQNAKTQAERVLAKKREKIRRFELKQAIQQQVEYKRAYINKKNKSRADEMEDRWLGPLAPKRYVNEMEKAKKNAISNDELYAPPLPKHERIKHWNIVPGDRVLILTGMDKHKIGLVKTLHKESNSLTVEGMNQYNVEFPDYILEAMPKNEKKTYTAAREKPINYNDVRLVVPLPNPETGALEDTVIANLEVASLYYDRETGRRGWKRVIAGEGTVIPWPKGNKPEKKDQDGDTRIMDVENVTFKPTLLKPPVPIQIIDELRNKYGKFRTRHSEEYIEKKLQEERDELARKAVVRTPLQELNRKLRLERKALGRPTLSEDMLERIGRVMAQNKPEALARIRESSSVEAVVQAAI